MIWSVPVPGFGVVFVDANGGGDAVVAVQRYLNRNRIRLEEGGTVGSASPSSVSAVKGRLTLNSSGDPISIEPEPVSVAIPPKIEPDDFIPLPELAVGQPDMSSAPPQPAQPTTVAEQASVSTSPTFVGKIVGSDGVPRYYRVESTDTGIARRILERVLDGSGRVEIVSTAEFLAEQDSDFRSALESSGADSLEAFVSGLEMVTEPLPAPAEPDPVTLPTDQEIPAETLPFDVQDFPYASFQNAVAALGLNPEGSLGSTVGRRFDTLAPVAQIGSITGTIDPIGQSPGALQNFFSDRFGDLNVATQTFRDLLAGRTGIDANAENLLALRALQNPDVATTAGRSAAADVFRLARAAAEDRFGSFVASRILPSNQRLFRELERELAQGSAGTGFLEFARNQNLLPA